MQAGCRPVRSRPGPAAAIILADCGVAVGKHDNCNFSSNSRSADILVALGVSLDTERIAEVGRTGSKIMSRDEDERQQARAARPIHAMLSQVLVAYTIEADNVFELRMADTGNPGARLSLFAWFNALRFLVDAPATVSELERQAIAPLEGMRARLACLERWRFVALGPRSGAPSTTKREGWGSSRGIRLDSIVRLTRRGCQAASIWPAVLDEIERRWKHRCGAALNRLRPALLAIIDSSPKVLPMFLSRRLAERPLSTQVGSGPAAPVLLPTLLSQVLQLFAIEFDGLSETPLALCANTIRAIGNCSVPERELPHLTGCSPETSDFGWPLKPYVALTADDQRGRGKVLRLTPRGLRAASSYERLTEEIERRWVAQFGRATIGTLREALQTLLNPSPDGVCPVADALIPPPGTARAGAQVPALGRRTMNPAARQRMRDLVAQTDRFVRDPAGTLPHYPLWDMNRGYGP